MKTALLGGLAALVAACALSFGGGQPARANGVPQLVKLTYLDGVSNFGPKDAEGVLEFSFAEAYARFDVKNLKPIDGYVLEGWLKGPGEPLFVGAIVPNASGVGVLDTKLKGLTRYDYNTFVIAARKTSAAEGQPGTDISIAGRFTVLGDEGQAAAGGDVKPSNLPDTGESPAMSTRQRVGRTVTIAAASAGLAFFFLRYMRRRRVTSD
ncbi:MAG: hypothetical protein ABI577_02090 [bacterium]